MKKLAFSLLFCILVLHGTIDAKDYLASSPAEAGQLFNKAEAGDRIFLKDGTYTDAVLKLHNTNGNSENPVIFSAQTPGKVFFEGNSCLSLSGRFLIIRNFTWRNGGVGLGDKSVVEFRNGKSVAEHSTLEDCIIDNYNSADFEHSENKWVSLMGTWNTVTRCLFKNKINRGPTVTVWLESGIAAHHTISYNYFYIRGNAGGHDNGLESIRIGDSKTSFTAAHCVVALNRFEDCDGEIETISNKSFHNSYLHNTFYNNDGGLTLRHGNSCLVDGNFFDGGVKSKSYGVRVIGAGHSVINNYFYQLLGGKRKGYRSPVTFLNGLPNSPLSGYFQVKNAVLSGNIFDNCYTPYVYMGVHTRSEAVLAPDSVTMSDNLFYADKGKPGVVYEEMERPLRLTVSGNSIAGELLSPDISGFSTENKKGYTRTGRYIVPREKSAANHIFEKKTGIAAEAGADTILPEILQATIGRKYTLLSPGEVGPKWFKP